MSTEPQMSGSQQPFALPYFRIAVVSVVTVIIFAFTFNFLTKEFLKSIDAARRASLAQLVHVARNGVEHVVEKIRSGRISRNEGLLEIRDLVRRMVYEDQYGKNYVFMSAYDGTMLVQPYEPKKELTSQWLLKDSNGTFIIQELIRTARSHPEGGFVSYHYPPPNSRQPQEKLAFVIGIPELNCYIGTGMYLQKFYKEQQSILKWTQYSSIFFAALVALLAFISLREILARNKALSAEIQKVVKARRELREVEEKYQIIVENVAEGIFQSTPEGRFITVNPAMTKMCGYSSPEEMISGVQDVAIQHYADPHKRNEFMKILAEQERVDNFEIKVFRKDGTTFWAAVNARAVYDEKEKICYYEGTHNDVTERKRAEEELVRSEERYRNILREIQESYIEVNLSGNFTFVNQATCQNLGYSLDELIGQNFSIIVSGEDDVRVVFEAYNRVFKTGEPQNGFTFRVVSKDGRIGYTETSISLMKNEQGNPIGFRSIARDITERKLAEDNRRDLEERLQRSEKMESLGILAGGVAHDLNNVLGIVIGYSELLLMKTEELSPIKSDVMHIMQGGERAAAIVQDLLTLARRGVQTKNVVNLNTTIVECQKTPEFEKIFSLNSRVRINTDLTADLLNIMGSPVHLGKTIINLVSNAVEAMPKGGLLKITTTNQYLDRPVQGYDNVREGDYVVLSFYDTGEGIAASDIKRIFEPFYTKKVMGRSGTGLGLAVVWGTVKDHNGYIDVQSAEGKGTTFTLYFPVTREDMSQEQIPVSVSDYLGTGEFILVVDDVDGQRELATRMLSKLNYQVKSAASGEEAVTYLKANKVDLIVLDMIMDPGMDGLDTYRKIVEINPGQKAIIVSGFSESEQVKEAQILGAGSYVKKPYVLERLGLAVRKELDRK
jgi:PAS domain S-box-containing protein